MNGIEAILRIIAPHECLGCKQEGTLLCVACAADVPTVISSCYRCQAVTEQFRTCIHCKASALRAVTAAVEYGGHAKTLMWRLKFGRASAAASDMARLMTLPALSADTILVHIPTATVRQRQRGYDQAQLLARHLARQHKLPHRTALARLGQQRQVGTSGAERRRQLQAAFRVLRPERLAGKHVILIDDVLTTGATLEAAATLLKKAGARRVDAAVFARA